jgi:SAM-dependent methyltransferase
MFDTYEAIFAARAASYQRAMAWLPHARDGEFGAMVAPLGDLRGKSVCDMPAGGGYLHRYLGEDVHYVAVEPSALFLAACPTRFGCRSVESAIEDVPLPSGFADAVVSLAGLHHSPDLAAVFREMRRLVVDGGRVVIADVAANTPPANFLNGYVDAHNPMGHRGAFLDGATAGLLRHAGLQPVSDKLVDITWSFSGSLEAAEYCSALFGIESVSPGEVAEAIETQLGRGVGSGAYNMRWPLRRIVCTPV